MNRSKVYSNSKEEPEILLCKDCVHSRLPLHYRIFNSLLFDSELVARIETGEMRCRKVLYTRTINKDNFVTGPDVTVFKNIYCNDERLENLSVNSFGKAQCGKQGKLWSPKKKEDLFKLLKR